MKHVLFVFVLFSSLAYPFFSQAVGPYTDNNNGTVTDVGTALIWQKTSDNVQREWNQALSYCNQLTLAGYSDWRLPNIRELRSIVEDDIYNPALDSIFDGSISSSSSTYWSSTTIWWNQPYYAYSVEFYDGGSGMPHKYLQYYSRCVRGGLTAPAPNLSGILSLLLFSNKEKPVDTTKIVIGDEGIISAFKGKELLSDIKVFVGYKHDEASNYTYTLLSGPSGLTISSGGIIEYDVQSNANTESLPFSVRITRKSDGKSYSEDAAILVMETDIVASGTIGSEGGQISDEWGDVVLTVPGDAVEGEAFFEVLRGINEDGYYNYTIQTASELLKLLQLRLPDPILRKAPEGSAVESISQAMTDEEAERADSITLESGWKYWNFWPARYIEVTSGVNAENRLRSDLPDNSEPDHKSINHNVYSDAAGLFSLCSKDAYVAECEGKTPVLFVHGYNPNGKLGGGEGTWGKMRELIAAEGYAVFEFRWRTNARFVDAAANLADAIQLIQEKSHKKVHIIAHSFGGLVSRAYLQNYATGRPYQENVESLITLGTPHSGIFDTDNSSYTLNGKEYVFKRGQDSGMFEGCMQISCQQAGEPTPEAWTVEQMFGFGSDINLSLWLGIDTDPGKLIAQLQETSGTHALPVDTLVLMGLPAGSSYFRGDGLITYAGQRFDRTWGDTIAKQQSVEFGDGNVREYILGVSTLDPDAVPGGIPSQDLHDLWYKNNLFCGYFHSSAVLDYKNFFPNAAAEAYVPDTENFHKTGDPHSALMQIKAWLKPAEISEPLTINLNLQVIDSVTRQGVSGAQVYVNVGGSICSSTTPDGGTDGVTDANGNLTLELPFYPSTKYTASVIAEGYHYDEFDTGYTTSSIPILSSTDFGTIELQSSCTSIPTVTSTATGRVWMDRNLGASRVATSMDDEQAYGELYQWGRGRDGHEKRTSGTTTTMSSTDDQGHGNFIIGNQDWRSPSNPDLWQGTNGINNPCPDGFRLPTTAELRAEIDTWNSEDPNGAFLSPLKLPLAGSRSYIDGQLNNEGSFGGYWTSSTSNGIASFMGISDNDGVFIFCGINANGMSVRCIQD